MWLLTIITLLALSGAVTLPAFTGHPKACCWDNCGSKLGKCSWCGPKHACCVKSLHHDDCHNTTSSIAWPTCLEIDGSAERLLDGKFSQKSIIPSLAFERKDLNAKPRHLSSLKIYDGVAYTGGQDGNIYEINLTSMVVKSHPWIHESGHKDSITCIDATEDLLITGSVEPVVRSSSGWTFAGVVQIWHRKNMTMITELTDHTFFVNACRIEGNTLVTASADHSAIVYDLEDKWHPKKMWVLKGHRDALNTVDISDDYIATAGDDNQIQLWNRTDGTLVRTFRIRRYLNSFGSIKSIRFVDNQYLLSAGWETTFQLWTVHSNTAVKTLEYSNLYSNYLFKGDHVGYVDVKDGLIFATFARRENIMVFVWDSTADPPMPDKPEKVIRSNHTKQIRAIDATDTKIVTVGWDGRVNAIDIYPPTAKVSSARKPSKEVVTNQPGDTAP